MRLRLLTTVLGCVCAFTSASSFGEEVKSPTGTICGMVTLCEGEAALYRGYKGISMKRGTNLQSGDRIIVGPDARVAMTFNNGPVVALGNEAELAIDCTADRWNFLLTTGEARVVHDGKSTLRLMSDQTILTVDRAIAHMQAQPGQTVLEVTNGSAVCEANEGRSWPVSGPGAINVDASGRVQPVGKVAWKLDGQQIRLVTAMQTSPVLQQPSVTPPVVVTPPALPANSPGANGESPAPLVDATLTDPTSDVTEPAPLDDQFGPMEDREEEPRIAEEPLPSETRSAFEDAFANDSSFSSTIGTFSGNSSLSLGSFSGGTGVFASGGVPGDANQQTFQGMDTTNGNQPFAGAIHLVTGFTANSFSNVQLSSTEAANLFPSGTGRYFSIGEGTAPSGQVVTGFLTGTGVTPNVIAIPKVGAYLVELDQYGIPDPGQTLLTTPPTPQTEVTGFTGLTGTDPTSPFVINATPIEEVRSTNQINTTATFALGEFLVWQDTNGAFTIDTRRSDQDRRIVKDVNGNDADDVVTPNGDVTFGDVTDPRFLPQSPTVKAPTGVANTGTSFRELNDVRRGAFTTLMADQLKEYAGRTGQTRFVVDGKIVDISGYK